MKIRTEAVADEQQNRDALQRFLVCALLCDTYEPKDVISTLVLTHA